MHPPKTLGLVARSFLLGAAIMALAPVSSATAQVRGMFQPVDLEPITHRLQTLTVVDDAGQEHVYSQSDLENLTTYQVATTTPWRDEETVFEGVLLHELLSMHGIMGPRDLRVTAQNDYVIEIENRIVQTESILIATRANGRPLGRRDRGPYLFVVPDQVFNGSGGFSERHLVWMAARLSLAE